jgi:membrane protease YdiL (CAAX protease family)
MLGIIVELAISWVLLWLIEKKHLSALGLIPTKRRIFQFLFLFFVAGLCCASGYLLRMYYGEKWAINPSITFSRVLEALWWNIKSVLYEELIYRGAILYILLKRFGAGWGIVLSSIAFGIYHWFSFEVVGNIPGMIQVFLITGAMGLVLAYAFWKTWSMYAAIGIHLGWNFVTLAIFSGGTIGNQVLVHLPTPAVQVSYFEYGIVVFLPIISVLLLSFLLLRRMRDIRTLPVENEDVKSQ